MCVQLLACYEATVVYIYCTIADINFVVYRMVYVLTHMHEVHRMITHISVLYCPSNNHATTLRHMLVCACARRVCVCVYVFNYMLYFVVHANRKAVTSRTCIYCRSNIYNMW